MRTGNRWRGKCTGQKRQRKARIRKSDGGCRQEFREGISVFGQ